MSINKSLFRDKPCRTRSGTILGTSTLVLWALALTFSGCMGSPESGGSIQFQTYNDNPYYYTPSQTPGWLQLQAPASVTVSKNFSMEVLARDVFSNPYLLPVNVTLSITNTTTSTAVAPPVTLSQFNGLFLYAPFSVPQVGTYTISATAPGFAPYTSTFTALPGPPTQLVFSGGPTPRQLNTSSCTPIAISVADAGGNLTTNPSAITISLVTAPAGNGLTFYSSADCSGTAVTGSVPMVANAGTLTLSAWDDTPEQGTLTASSASFPTITLPFNTAGSSVFVLGGYNGSYSNKVQGSTDGGQSWTYMNPVNPSLPFPSLAYGNAVVFNNTLYYLGGLTTGGVPSSAIYSSTNGTDWNLVPTAQLPQSLYQGQVVVFNHKLWYLGGYTTGAVPTSTVWSYDGTTPTTLGTSGFSAHAGGAVYSKDGVVYVMGGDQTAGSITSRVSYSTNATLTTWTFTNIFTSGLADMAYALFDGLFYLIGGQTAISSGAPINTVSTTTTGTTLGTANNTCVTLFGSSATVTTFAVNTPQMLLTGGTDGTIYSAETCVSTDGVTWTPSGNLMQNGAFAPSVTFTPGL